MIEAAANVLAAVAATFRLTDMILGDRIFEGLRQRFPGYPINCPRCMSVWAGAACTAIYLLWPFGNWPLAFSWYYLFLLAWFNRVQNHPGRAQGR